MNCSKYATGRGGSRRRGEIIKGERERSDRVAIEKTAALSGSVKETEMIRVCAHG